MPDPRYSCHLAGGKGVSHSLASWDLFGLPGRLARPAPGQVAVEARSSGAAAAWISADHEVGVHGCYINVGYRSNISVGDRVGVPMSAKGTEIHMDRCCVDVAARCRARYAQ